MSDDEYGLSGGGGQSSRKGKLLAELLTDEDAMRELIGRVVPEGTNTVGLSDTDVRVWSAKIYALFPGLPQEEVDIGLTTWAILNGVGGMDDYTTKSDVIISGRRVAATAVFGGIIPTGVLGMPRKFMSAKYEKVVPSILKLSPNTRKALAPRLARAGLRPGQELHLVDFVRGVTDVTASQAGERSRAKNNLLRQKNTVGRIPGAETIPLPVEEIQHGNGFDRHANSNLY